MTRQFCTYFDHRYLPRALVLHESLREHLSDFHLWMLCMDEAAEEMLARLELESVTAISLRDVEKDDERLAAAKLTRSLVEYYFTCTPSLPRFVLRHAAGVDEVTYLDADLFFLASPEELFEEMGDSSIAIIPHRFPKDRAADFEHGIYNVGWLTFRRTPDGLAALEWWRDRCIEWCFDRVEEGKYADQRYLDDWPTRFAGVHVVQHPGANLAPWNVRTHDVEECSNGLCADGRTAIFYHVQGLREVVPGWYRLGLEPYAAHATPALRKYIYKPYLRRLEAATRTTQTAGGAPLRNPQVAESRRTRVRQLARLWIRRDLARAPR